MIQHRWRVIVVIWGIALTAGVIPWMTGGGSIVPLLILVASGAGATMMLTAERAEPPSDPPQDWTRRELEVLALIAAGYTNDEIATELVIALSTVKTHINNIYRKLGVANRVQAAARARALELVR